MAISMHGLDLSFLRDNPLPKRRRKQKRPDFSRHRAEGIAIPAFIGDIAPFVANATRDTVEITSRSQLRAYERANNIRQCGDYKPRQIVTEQSKRMEAATYVSPEDKKAVDFKWVD
jgi:hypothetical protein